MAFAVMKQHSQGLLSLGYWDAQVLRLIYTDEPRHKVKYSQIPGKEVP